jgi:hypothetical protein
MKLVLDDDAAYSHFQFFWYSLIMADPKGYGTARLMLEADLRAKLANLSRPLPDKVGRVLLQPCELRLSVDEQLALIERVSKTGWKPEARPHADAALSFLRNP